MSRGGSLAVLLLSVACGGESRRTTPAPAPTPAPASTTPPVPSDCPETPTDLDAGVPRHGCPALLLDIDPRAHDTCPSGGVTVEPLQLPESIGLLEPSTEPLPSQDPDPSTWDTSARPAGACVFRLHGVDAGCYAGGGVFFTGACAAQAADPGTWTPGFADDRSYCVPGPVPGCPSADPQWQGVGYWWYLVDQGDAADLVICAQECWHSFYAGGCLALDPILSSPCR